ncbi:MAG TPA: insulinase family protein [Candidatus Polarisedimenticolaceae bacterium]
MLAPLLLAVSSWGVGPGTTVAFLEDRRAPIVTLVVQVPAGTHLPWARERDLETAWTSQSRDPEGALRARADALAVDLSLGVGPRSATLRATFLRDDLDDAVALLRDVLSNRALDEEELKTRRRAFRFEREAVERTTDFRIGLELAKRLYEPGDPRRAEWDDPLTPSADAGRLVAARDAALRLPGRIVGFAGALSREEAELQFGRLGLPDVGEAPSGMHPEYRPMRAPGPEVASIPVRKLTQVYFGYGRAAPAWTDPDDAAFQIADHVLGGHFYSRLSVALRHQRGDTYGAWTEDSTGAVAGWVVAKTFTRAGNAEATEAHLREVVKRLHEQGISEEERAAAAGYLLGRRAFAKQSPEQVLTTWMNERTLGLPVGFFDARAQRAASIPLEEIQRFVRRFYDPKDWGLVRIVPSN